MAKQAHSRSYHRYFENYAEKEILGPDGSRRIQRVYVGKYYRVDLSDQQLRKQRITFALLYFFALLGYFSGALTARVSAVSLVALATMPPLVALLFLCVSVFYRLTVPREMEIRAYRDSSENLIRNSMWSLVLLMVCFAATLAGTLLVPVFTLRDSILPLLSYAISAGATFMIHRTESNTPYRTILPKQERPCESSPIRYEMPD